AGNRSSQTTLLVTTAACPDTAAPSSPSGLTVKSASTNGISLGWTPSTDNVAVAGYDLFRNGTKAGSTTSTAYTFSALTCGTTYTLGVDAYDAAGNTSNATSVAASTAACSAPVPQLGAPPKYRYLYNSGSSTAIAQDGWNLYDVSSKSVADALPAGSQSLY